MPCPFTRCCTGFLPAIPQTLLSSPQKRASETLALQHVDKSFHFVRARQAVPFHAMLRRVPTGDPSNAAPLSAENSQRDAGAATHRQYAPGGCATAQGAGQGWKKNQGRKRRRSLRRG